MEQLVIEYVGPIVPKPRMTRRDVWLDPARPCVARYRKFKAEFLAQAIEQGYRFSMDVTKVHIFCELLVSKSWPQKKKLAQVRQPHRQRPDADNILKGVCDALAADDSGIYDMRSVKRWGLISCMKVVISYDD